MLIRYRRVGCTGEDPDVGCVFNGLIKKQLQLEINFKNNLTFIPLLGKIPPKYWKYQSRFFEPRPYLETSEFAQVSHRLFKIFCFSLFFLFSASDYYQIFPYFQHMTIKQFQSNRISLFGYQQSGIIWGMLTSRSLSNFGFF